MFKTYMGHPMTWSPADDGAGGGADGGDDAAAAAADAGAAADDGGAAAAKWWDSDKFTDAHRTALTAKGFAADDPIESWPKALDAIIAADRRLGDSPDNLISKPKEGETLADYMRKNAAAFGLPESKDGYEVTAPEDWPKDAPWDTALAGELQQVAFDHGLTRDAAQALTGLYAKKVATLEAQATTELKDSNAAMMAELEKDLGDQLPGKIEGAKRAMQLVAEAAGLDAAAQMALAAGLKPKVGDAGTMRLFMALGDMLGEETLLGAGKGGGMATTPAEARQRLAAMRAPDGEYSKAFAAGNRAEMKRLAPIIEGLEKIAAGG